MNYKFIPLIISFFLILSSCATTANYEKVLASWIGSDVDSLVKVWGPPQGSYTLSDGSLIIEYSNQSNMIMGGYTYNKPQTNYHYGNGYISTTTTYTQHTTPVYNVNLWCKTIFTSDPNGIITSWKHEGNNCVSDAPK